MKEFIDWFSSFDPSTQAVIAGLYTWLLTAMGSATVFFFRTINRKVMDIMLGFAAGVMLAVSFWGLLMPAMQISEEAYGSLKWVPVVMGFLVGGGFIYMLDVILPHLHISGIPSKNPEGIKTGWHRSILIVLSITLHNIPEGLAIGVAFGAASLGFPEATIAGAIALAIGIGLQDIPEGAVVSVPLRREGVSRKRSFFYGQLSGIVEPVAALCGALMVSHTMQLMPYALAFSAGAMIYIVVEELIPESQQCEHSNLSTIGIMVGFALMMVLDVALA